MGPSSLSFRKARQQRSLRAAPRRVDEQRIGRRVRLYLYSQKQRRGRAGGGRRGGGGWVGPLFPAVAGAETASLHQTVVGAAASALRLPVSAVYANAAVNALAVADALQEAVVCPGDAAGADKKAGAGASAGEYDDEDAPPRVPATTSATLMLAPAAPFAFSLAAAAAPARVPTSTAQGHPFAPTAATATAPPTGTGFASRPATSAGGSRPFTAAGLATLSAGAFAATGTLPMALAPVASTSTSTAVAADATAVTSVGVLGAARLLPPASTLRDLAGGDASTSSSTSSRLGSVDSAYSSAATFAATAAAGLGSMMATGAQDGAETANGACGPAAAASAAALVSAVRSDAAAWAEKLVARAEQHAPSPYDGFAAQSPLPALPVLYEVVWCRVGSPFHADVVAKGPRYQPPAAAMSQPKPAPVSATMTAHRGAALAHNGATALPVPAPPAAVAAVVAPHAGTVAPAADEGVVRAVRTTRVTLTGLQPSARYVVFLRAVGAWGAGPLGAPLALTTGPRQPYSLVAVGGTDGAGAGAAAGYFSSCEALDLDNGGAGLGAWKDLPPMGVKRAFASAALLRDRVIVTGGFNADPTLAQADWTLLFPRAAANGGGAGNSVLSRTTAIVASSVSGAGAGAGVGTERSNVLASAEALDLASHSWVPLPSMLTPRRWHATAVTQDKLLVTGGFDGVARVAACECYDPRLNTWVAAANMTRARDSHAAVTAPDGRVFVLGGYDGFSRLSACEVYDPHTDTWAAIASMSRARDAHAAVYCNGRIVVVGGYDGSQYLRSVEVYDIRTDTWTAGPPLVRGRAMLCAALLPGARYSGEPDRVVVAGGSDGLGCVKSTEILVDKARAAAAAMGAAAPADAGAGSSPAQWTWTAGPSMRVARAGLAAVALPAHADLAPGVPDYATVRKARLAEKRRQARAAAQDQAQW